MNETCKWFFQERILGYSKIITFLGKSMRILCSWLMLVGGFRFSDFHGFSLVGQTVHVIDSEDGSLLVLKCFGSHI